MKVLTPEEKQKHQALRKNTPLGHRINLLIYVDGEFAGWSFGFQKLTSVFYMCNSAILPEFRRKGLYTRLLHEMMARVKDLGFQEITSRHSVDNNSVIIPKLKVGFTISGMEISDMWGTLVNLTYYFNETRRKVLSYRTGEMLDPELRKYLGL